MFATGKVEATEDLEVIPSTSRGSKASVLFWLWFASNLTIGDFLIGLLAQDYGLGYSNTVIALGIGTILGGVLLALMSVMGPVFGMSQMRIGRYTFGRKGGIVMSLLQWGNTLGWFTFNSIIAASALALAIGVKLYAIPIAVTVILVLALILLGHKTIQRFERGMSLVLGILFIIILAYSIEKIGVFGPPVTHAAFSAASFGWIVAFSFSYIMSWGPYASDYSKHLYTSVSRKSIAVYVLLGSGLASFFSELVGYYVGMATNSTSPNPAQPLAQFLGKYALIGLYFLFLGGLSANAINLYSNTMSIRAAGVKLERRYIAVIVTAVAGVLAYLGYNSFYVSYENFLFILDYWITPWIAVMLVDFFLRYRLYIKGGYREVVNYRAIFSYLLGITVSVPFMYPSEYFIGPIAYRLGFDISYFVSFIVAGLAYYILQILHENKSTKSLSHEDGSS
jgi:NCS1 family nucleobase:cation symporter-1